MAVLAAPKMSVRVHAFFISIFPVVWKIAKRFLVPRDGKGGRKDAAVDWLQTSLRGEEWCLIQSPHRNANRQPTANRRGEGVGATAFSPENLKGGVLPKVKVVLFPGVFSAHPFFLRCP